MPIVDVVNGKNSKTGQLDLPDGLFAGRINRPLLHEVTIIWQRNQRSGTVSTKGRSEVSGGGRKPFKQKGTGRARAGSSRSPLWPGGGTVHGPKPRDYEVRLPRQKTLGALAAALSLRFKEGDVILLDEMPALDKPSTSRLAGLLKSLGIENRKVLFVMPRPETLFELSSRNIDGVMAVTAESLNPYLVLYHQKLVIFKEAVTRMKEIFG